MASHEPGDVQQPMWTLARLDQATAHVTKSQGDQQQASPCGEKMKCLRHVCSCADHITLHRPNRPRTKAASIEFWAAVPTPLIRFLQPRFICHDEQAITTIRTTSAGSHRDDNSLFLFPNIISWNHADAGSVGVSPMETADGKNMGSATR